ARPMLVSGPDFARNAHVVRAEDVSDIVLAVSTSEELLGNDGKTLGFHQQQSLRVLVRWVRLRMRLNKVDHLLLIKHIVERETDVLRTDHVGDVVDVSDDQLCGDIVFTQEYANAIDTNDPTGLCAAANRLVTDVTGMIAQGTRIGVRKDYRLARALEDLHRAALPDMRAAHDHPDTLHFFQDGSAKVSEPFVSVLTAARESVITVVRE